MAVDVATDDAADERPYRRPIEEAKSASLGVARFQAREAEDHLTDASTDDHSGDHAVAVGPFETHLGDLGAGKNERPGPKPDFAIASELGVCDFDKFTLAPELRYDADGCTDGEPLQDTPVIASRLRSQRQNKGNAQRAPIDGAQDGRDNNRTAKRVRRIRGICALYGRGPFPNHGKIIGGKEECEIWE